MNLLDGFEKMINGKLKGDIVVVKKSANVSMSWHFFCCWKIVLYFFKGQTDMDLQILWKYLLIWLTSLLIWLCLLTFYWFYRDGIPKSIQSICMAWSDYLENFSFCSENSNATNKQLIITVFDILPLDFYHNKVQLFIIYRRTMNMNKPQTKF